MKFPKYIFFTGAPGSAWSVTAKTLETIPLFNTSDRSVTRQYRSPNGANHNGIYYGESMELQAKLDADYLDTAWQTTDGTRLIKSHEWAFQLDDIETKFPGQWIMLVVRPDDACSKSWFDSGGFSITYPNYQSYADVDTMNRSIADINTCITAFADKHQVKFEKFDSSWIERNFLACVSVPQLPIDLRVALIRL